MHKPSVVAIALLLCAVLCACTPTTPAAPAVSPPQTLYLSVDATLANHPGPQRFAQAVERISEGALTIELIYPTAEQPAQQEQIDLLFVPDTQMANSAPDLEALLQPFFWRDQAHLSAFANHPDQLSLAARLLPNGTVPLGVYYGGTDGLISATHLMDNGDWEELQFVITPDSQSQVYFSSLAGGIEIIQPEELAQRLWDNPNAVGECSIEAAHAMAVGQQKYLFFAPLAHRVHSAWLLEAPQLAQTLTLQQRAILEQAVAISLYESDTLLLHTEASLMRDMSSGIITAEEDYINTRSSGDIFIFEEIFTQKEWNQQLIAQYRGGIMPGRFQSAD